MPVNYYKVLGVPQDAPFRDIRKAYMAKAMQYHPDKAGSGNEEVMKDLNEAFDVLKDPQKRMLYDAQTCIIPESTADWNQVNALVMQFMNFMAAVVAARKSQAPPQPPPQVPSVLVVSINVPLEDLYTAAIKKLSVKVVRLARPGHSFQTLYISLMNYQESYMFEGMGDEISPNVFGDIRVDLNVTPHSKFSIDNDLCRYDLHCDYTITLADYFYGKTIEIEHLDGSIVDVRFEGLVDKNKLQGVESSTGRRCHVVYGAGLPYVDEETLEHTQGDLYIFFEVDLTRVNMTELSSTQVQRALCDLCSDQIGE